LCVRASSMIAIDPSFIDPSFIDPSFIDPSFLTISVHLASLDI